MERNQEFRPTRSKYLVITADYVIPILVVAASVLMWWIIFYSPIFVLKHTQCELDFEPCQNANIVAEVEKLHGQNLIRLPEDDLSNRLMSADFTIREVVITKHLPDSLTVSLQSVYPVVAATVRGNPTWITFDTELRVIGVRTRDPNVPSLILPELSGIFVGEKIANDELNKALSLTRSLSGEISGVKTTELEGNTITISLDQGIQAVMTTAKDLPTQIRALQAVLANATMLAGVNVIDVRFNQPVLK